MVTELVDTNTERVLLYDTTRIRPATQTLLNNHFFWTVMFMWWNPDLTLVACVPASDLSR